MAETFREFFKRQHGFEFPAQQGELTKVVMDRMVGSMADWMDELAKRIAPEGPSPSGTDLMKDPWGQ